MGNRERRLSTKLISFCVIFIVFIAACNGNPAPERTPTIQPSPTLNETEIALLWTDTPSPSPSSTWTASPTITPSVTNSPTGTPPPTETNTPTSTVTNTVTASPSATDTPQPTSTNTALPTDTFTPRPSITNTPEPSETHTAIPTNTSTPRPTSTDTPEPSSTNTAIPTDTFTPQPTDTQTPRPSSTPQPIVPPTVTLIPTNTPSLTLEPSATTTLTPTATETELPSLTPSVTTTLTPTRTLTITPFSVDNPTVTPTLEGTGAPNVDDTPDFGTPVPTVVIGDATPDQIDTSGTAIPFASPTEQIFPTPLPSPGGGGPAFTPTRFQFGTGSVSPSNVAFQGPNGGYTSGTGEQQGFGALSYDIGPGNIGAFFFNDGLTINGTYLTTSPSSDVGWPGDKQVIEMRWSPNGRYLAFVIRGDDPSEVDYGVWVYDTVTGAAHQIMRNDWDYREARHIRWSPNSTVVLITLDHPNGPSHTFLPAEHSVHVPYDQEEFSDATWSWNSGSIVVSGVHHDGSVRLGRVMLDEAHTYVPILNLPAGEIGVARAAIEGNNGQILFLGGPSQTGPFRLYQLYPGGAPTVISNGSIAGNIASWEWNDSRTSLLLVVNTANGREAWQIDASGAMANITPPGGVTGEVRWE